MRWIVLTLLLGFASIVHAQSYRTAVVPLPIEDFVGTCHYDIKFPAGKHAVRAVWVTYDRGRDIMRFYSDPDVVAFARHHNLALMMPHQCVGKNAPGGPEEMDMDPSHGAGRALFTALDQFAAESGHPELSSAKLILLGFSGTGALFAHFVEYAPDRVVASIPTNAGHYNPMGLDTVQLAPAGIEVPELVVAGGADKVSGTQRPYEYFRKFRDRGAPWAFLVQNRTPHCCIVNTKPLMLVWLNEILELRQPSSAYPLHSVDVSRGWNGYIRTCSSDVHDSWGTAAWNVCEARISKSGNSAPRGMIAAGWLPSHRVAKIWLDFIQQPAHSIASQP
jgi:dienelactone hydrolase